jgi:hypothetical protein
MRGSSKVGRWLPFRARQVLSPNHGFVWSASAAAFTVGETPVELELRLDEAGRVVSLAFDRWVAGEFFRYRITELDPVGASPSPAGPR